MGLEELKEKHDTNQDGEISNEELERAKYLTELELREEKADAQKKMAWVAVGTMLFFTMLLFSPVISDGRVTALSDLLGLFYITQAGIVGAYMGVSAWMSKK